MVHIKSERVKRNKCCGLRLMIAVSVMKMGMQLLLKLVTNHCRSRYIINYLL